MSASRIDDAGVATELAAELSAARDVTDALEVLFRFGLDAGVDVWLLAAESDLWHGYVFASHPVDGGLIQDHMTELAERFRALCPEARTLSAPSGIYPVRIACERLGETMGAIVLSQDFEVQVAGELLGLVRVGSAEGGTEPDWELVSSMMEVAAPYLAYLLRGNGSDEQGLLDPLTGLYSRSYFADQLKREVRRAASYCAELSLMVVDVHPRQPGLPVAAHALRALARTLTEHTRKTDICARMGPARLAVLMPHSGAREALKAASRIEETINSDPDIVRDHAVSIGISGWNLQGPDETRLLEQAAEAARLAAQGPGGPFVYA